jgi:uncharacterized membrane protein YbaN (DUF454 family)
MSTSKEVISKAKKLTLTLLGFIFVAIGIIGIVVPGLPTTVFMIIAAWLFSISNPKFEKWLLGLPKIGPAISNYRKGLALSSISIFTAFAAIIVLENLFVRLALISVAVFGIWYIVTRVPTRENITDRN